MIHRALARRLGGARAWNGPWGPSDGSIPPAWADDGLTGISAFGGGINGLPVNEQRALRASAVYACTDVIATDVSTLPIHRFQRDGDKRRQVDDPALFGAPMAGEIDDVSDWSSRLLTSAVLRGSAYGRVLEVDDVGATRVDPLHPDNVRPFRDDQNRLRFRVQTGGKFEILDPWPAGELWFWRGLTLAGHDEGLSPIAAAQMAVTLALAAENFGAEFFLDGSLPSSVLEFPSGTFGDNPAGRAKARQTLRDFERIHRGRRRTALVQGGAWKPVTINPNEAQFIETRKLQLEDIARIFRVKPHKIGILERATFSNIEHQGIEHVVDTIRPWTVRFERALDRLFPGAPAGEYTRINVSALLRGDMKTRFEAYQLARQGGWESPNSILALEDRDPIGPAGDVYLQPLNMRDAAQESIGERAKAAELLRRAGFEPESIARMLGLTGLDVADTPPAPAPPSAGELADLMDQNTGGSTP